MMVEMPELTGPGKLFFHCQNRKTILKSYLLSCHEFTTLPSASMCKYAELLFSWPN